MSVFLISQCKFDNETYANQLSWSNNDSIAAIASYSIDHNDKESYQVLFVNSEGIQITGPTIAHDQEATVFEWQPNGKIVVIGWADGMISSWLVDGKSRAVSTYSNSSQHNSPITMMKWNPTGKRLITGDKRGLVCVWSADVRGTLSPIRQYKRKGAITTAIFYVLPVKSDLLRKNENNSSSTSKNSYSPSFFFGTDQGVIVYADDLGHCSDVQQLPSIIDIMLFFEEKSRLIIITRSLLLSQYQVGEDGKVSRLSQVKLSITGDNLDNGLKYVVWAAPGLLAIGTSEKFLRLLDLVTDEGYTLSLSTAGDIIQKSDRVISISFSRSDRYLAVGTKLGIVLIWKFIGQIRDFQSLKSQPNNSATIRSTSINDWELIYKTQLSLSNDVVVSTPISQLIWHNSQSGILAAVTDEGVFILSEMVMQNCLCNDLAVVQTASHDVTVVVNGPIQESWTQLTNILIKGISVCSTAFILWSGKDARTYRIDTSIMKIEALDVFATLGTSMAIADTAHLIDEALFIADQNLVRICNYTGVQKGTISFSDAEGCVQHIDINGQFLAIVTDKGVLGVYDIHSPKKPKILGSNINIYDSITYIESANIESTNDRFKFIKSSNSHTLYIKKMKINSDGSCICVLTDHVYSSIKVKHPDSCVYVYDRNKGSVNKFDFQQFNRFPINIGWDVTDNRIIACETKRNPITASTQPTNILTYPSTQTSLSNLSSNNTSATEINEHDVEIELYTLFATSENGVFMQDSFPIKPPFGSFLGIIVPRLFFRNTINLTNDSNTIDSNAVKLYTKVMRDFVGISEPIDESIKSALIDFSYNITLGKLDEAYRSVKLIGNPALWENMAHMCVKTKRLDVAEVCLGNMGHARGAAAIREAKKNPKNTLEVLIGTLAIQLGLYDDAIRLFKEANRFDLVNNLYQAAGLWDKALKTSATSDRLHLKTTHYLYAKHLESINDIKNAMKHYQLTDTYQIEIPRMLYSTGQIDTLEDYIHNHENNMILLKWWASYLESNNRFDTAKKYYQRAGDYLSLVRIACFKRDFNKAADIIQDCNDKAAAYHFARQLENQGEYQESINYYSLAGCYNHSIRLAKAYALDKELMVYALKSTTSLMLDCANYFENKGEYEKAVQLYHKGGDIPKALDLCFQTTNQSPNNNNNSKVNNKNDIMYDMLNTIAQDLGSDTSPQTLARCAEFLVNHKQYIKAIDLYIIAKKYISAINLCLNYNITLTEDLAEKLTPSNIIIPDANERKDVLKELGKCLSKQGNYILASRKYIQANDRIHAIKCLIKSGDTKAIIQFANITRNNDIYILTANYLQSMNWKDDINILKSIILFYNKAKAYIQLSKFYDHCSNVEIDEYKDYSKAYYALKESLKYLNKIITDTTTNTSTNSSNTLDEVNKYITNIEKRLSTIEKFLYAKECYNKNEFKEMIHICIELISDIYIEDSIRSGDVYSLLIEYYYNKSLYQDAYHFIQEMEEKRLAINTYIDKDMLNIILRENGVYTKGKVISGEIVHGQSDEHVNIHDNDDVDEELDEVVEEDEDSDYSNKIQSRSRK